LRITVLACWVLALLVVGDVVPARGAQSAGSAIVDVGERPEIAAPTVASEAALAAVAALGSDLDRAMSVPGWRTDEWSVLVVSLDRGDTLFAREPDAALAPASNMKLFTSAAALYYLGPDYRFNTFLVTNGTIRDGVLDGDLIVYGTGDPTLSTRGRSAWQAFADTLEVLGIHTVAGAIVGDVSFFQGPGNGTGWRESYVNASYAAPANALTLNDNLVTVVVRPGQRPGEPAVVETVPGGQGVAIRNSATTTSGSGAQLRIGRDDYESPIVVAGAIGTGHAGISRVVPVGDGGNFAASVLRQVLAERGITVMGGVREIREAEASAVSSRTVFAPAFDNGAPVRTLAVHQSPPLVEILEVVNKQSHNLYAEQVIRAVGRAVLGEGSAVAGALATRYFLECETGDGDFVLEMVDGSGLSPLNRVSAGTLVRLLAYVAESGIWEAFWSTLPEAGRSDGLRRMYQTMAAGNLRAKTGTINEVSALSGYVNTRDGERLAFAIVSNQVPSTWRAKVVEDQIGARLAGFRRPDYVPVPAVAD